MAGKHRLLEQKQQRRGCHGTQLVVHCVRQGKERRNEGTKLGMGKLGEGEIHGRKKNCLIGPQSMPPERAPKQLLHYQPMGRIIQEDQKNMARWLDS